MKMQTKKKWQKNSNQSGNKSSEVIAKAPKVLIVEDNQFNVLPIQSTLTRNRIEYHLAKNGLMAVDRYNQAMKELYYLSYKDLKLMLTKIKGGIWSGIDGFGDATNGRL